MIIRTGDVLFDVLYYHSERDFSKVAIVKVDKILGVGNRSLQQIELNS
jgi:hypothetical protein